MAAPDAAAEAASLWTCKVCTFAENATFSRNCQVCGSDKPGGFGGVGGGGGAAQQAVYGYGYDDGANHQGVGGDDAFLQLPVQVVRFGDPHPHPQQQQRNPPPLPPQLLPHDDEDDDLDGDASGHERDLYAPDVDDAVSDGSDIDHVGDEYVPLQGAPRLYQPFPAYPPLHGQGGGAPWACAMCTYENSPILRNCEMCGSPKQ